MFWKLSLSTSAVEQSASVDKQNHKLSRLDLDKKNDEKTWDMNEGWKNNEESIFIIFAPKANPKF